MMNPRTRRILLGVVAFVAAILLARVACDLSRRAATQAVVNMVTQGEAGGRIPGDCPKCRRPYQLRVGQRLICPGCGTPLAACGQCGELIVGSATYRDRSDKIYLCAEHHADDKWVGERLAEYRAPAANTPPPNTAQAVAARAEYEKRLASCVERGVYPDKELFAEENAVSETALKTLPPGVNEAYQFYTRTVTDGDFGSAQVYLWQVSGKPIYIVLCTTDGSDGWVEVYDAHGKPLGCATTDDYKPTWTTKGVARRRVWGE